MTNDGQRNNLYYVHRQLHKTTTITTTTDYHKPAKWAIRNSRQSSYETDQSTKAIEHCLNHSLHRTTIEVGNTGSDQSRNSKETKHDENRNQKQDPNNTETGS